MMRGKQLGTARCRKGVIQGHAKTVNIGTIRKADTFDPPPVDTLLRSAYYAVLGTAYEPSMHP